MGIVPIVLELLGVLSGLLYILSGCLSESLFFTSSMLILISGILQLFGYNMKRINERMKGSD